MEERLMRHVADSAVIQTQIILSSHINGAGRLFGGQLMEWIDIVAGVVAAAMPAATRRPLRWTACSLKRRFI